MKESFGEECNGMVLSKNTGRDVVGVGAFFSGRVGPLSYTAEIQGSEKDLSDATGSFLRWFGPFSIHLPNFAKTGHAGHQRLYTLLCPNIWGTVELDDSTYIVFWHCHFVRRLICQTPISYHLALLNIWIFHCYKAARCPSWPWCWTRRDIRPLQLLLSPSPSYSS